MLHNYLREVKQSFFWRRISQSEIRNSAAAELKKLEQKQVELKRQLTYFGSDEYVERIARDKLLMAKEGETVLLLPQEIKNSEFIIQNSELNNLSGDPPNWQKWAKLFGW